MVASLSIPLPAASVVARVPENTPLSAADSVRVICSISPVVPLVTVTVTVSTVLSNTLLSESVTVIEKLPAATSLVASALIVASVPVCNVSSPTMAVMME